MQEMLKLAQSEALEPDEPREVRCLLIGKQAAEWARACGDVRLLRRRFQFAVGDCLSAGIALMVDAKHDVILLDESESQDLERDFEDLGLVAPGTPIVVVMEQGREADIEDALKLGARDYLVRESFDAEAWLRCLASNAENSDLERALGSLSKDPVTGLYNRQTFLTLAEQVLTMAPRTQGVLVLHLSLEVGSANCVEEHRMLLRAADLFRKTFRRSDILARWGRNEFVGMFLDTSPERAQELARRLEANLKEQNEVPGVPQQIRMRGGMTAYDLQRRLTAGQLVAHAQRAGQPRQRLRRPS